MLRDIVWSILIIFALFAVAIIFDECVGSRVCTSKNLEICQ